MTSAFRTGARTPSELAEALIERIRLTHEETPSLGAVIAHDFDALRADAAASTARYAAGTPRGPLDGVPVGVKDELDQRDFGTTVGTRFLGRGGT